MIFGERKKSKVKELETNVRGRIRDLVAKLRDPATPADERDRIEATLRKLNERCEEESRSVRGENHLKGDQGLKKA
jgi:hypothetical protein